MSKVEETRPASSAPGNTGTTAPAAATGASSKVVGKKRDAPDSARAEEMSDRPNFNMDECPPLPVPKKSGCGRRKIAIEYIDDKNRRHITFSKRKSGIMKKAYELSTLTGTQVLLLVASETGHVYTFATPKLQPLITKPEGKNLIQSCLNSNDPAAVLSQISSIPQYANPPGHDTAIAFPEAAHYPGHEEEKRMYSQVGRTGMPDDQHMMMAYNSGSVPRMVHSYPGIPQSSQMYPTAQYLQSAYNPLINYGNRGDEKHV